MPMRITDALLAEIRQSADIIDIISAVVPLKKNGREYLGLCPFHSEKTPSFTVSPAKQLFYCFGCGEGGDLFHFLMKHQGLSFPDAVRMMAGRHGIPLPGERRSPAERQRDREKHQAMRLHDFAAGYYRSLLREPAGRAAVQYLQKRRLLPDTVTAFGIGAASENWDGLVRHVENSGMDPAWLVPAGLALRRRSGQGYIDRFRNRLMLPIWDSQRRVVGFGGRALFSDQTPKYLNSPETVLFNKRRFLYFPPPGPAGGKRSGDDILLVEGYLDVIALWQHGIYHTAASLGTALGEDHVRLLRRRAERVILVFDGDEAGMRAAARSVRLLLRLRMPGKILTLPQGEDPDSFVFKNGPGRFLNLAENAAGLIPFLTRQAIARKGDDAEGKRLAVEEVAEVVAESPDAMARALYAREIADYIGVDESLVLERIQHHGKRLAKQQRKTAFPGAPSSFTVRGKIAGKQRGPMDAASRYPGINGSGHQDESGSSAFFYAAYPGGTDSRSVFLGERDSPDAGFRKDASRLEEKVIAMILQCPGMRDEIHRRDLLAYFCDARLRRLGECLLASAGSDETCLEADACGLIGGLDSEPERHIAARLAFMREEWDTEGCRRLLAQFERRRRSGREAGLLEKIENARRNGDQALLLELLAEKQRRARERESIT